MDNYHLNLCRHLFLQLVSDIVNAAGTLSEFFFFNSFVYCILFYFFFLIPSKDHPVLIDVCGTMWIPRNDGTDKIFGSTCLFIGRHFIEQKCTGV